MFADLNEPVICIAAALAGLVVGALIAWLVMRGRRDDVYAAGRASRDAEVAQLSVERDASAEARQRLARDHDAALRELSEQRARVLALSAQGATLAGRLERLTQIESDLAAARAEAKHWNEACQRAEQRLTESATRL
ncbi:MAG TPA: hypothetical protein VLB69_05770, partial [Rudaea sp.]|nr:hypothetical protein [Rudaea sp.]